MLNYATGYAETAIIKVIPGNMSTTGMIANTIINVQQDRASHTTRPNVLFRKIAISLKDSLKRTEPYIRMAVFTGLTLKIVKDRIILTNYLNHDSRFLCGSFA